MTTLNKVNDVCEKYRKKLKEIFETNQCNISVAMLSEFENFLRDNWACDTIKLYRYSNADYYNIRNFETGKLRLTNNGVLNDIFEGLPQGITDEQINCLADIVYMKCFTTNCDNTLMWAHYANENRGFCVEYDLSILDQDDYILSNIFPVIYEEDRVFRLDIAHIAEIVESQKCLNHDVRQNGIDEYDNLLETLPLFLIKNKEWEYENEWRIVFTKAELYLKKHTNFSNITIDFDCATGIYLGYRIENEVKKNILEIVERINQKRKEKARDCISVYESKLSDTTYNQRFEKIM